MRDARDHREVEGPGERQVAQLLKLAGHRPMPDEAQMSHAHAAARAEWRRVSARYRWRVWRLALSGAAAAAVLMIVIQTGTRPPAAVPPAELGSIERLVGSLLVMSAGQDQRLIENAGLPLRSGDRLEISADSRAAVALGGDISVRLDRGTIATFDADRVTLSRGAVYVDSRHEGPEAGLVIETPLGAVSHTGTQFEVRLLDDALRVRVREGTVALERRGTRWTSEAGSALIVLPGRAPRRERSPTFGPDWDWVTALAPPFRLEGATLTAFLDWAAREAGWRWRFESPALGRRVGYTVLHGSIAGLAPDEALAAVLPVCGLQSRRDGAQLVISTAQRE